MNERVRLAMEYRKKGYNCTQAVIGVFSLELGLPPELVFKISEGFGAGMGDTRGICGAISGAIMTAGLKNSLGPAQPVTKGSTYRLAKEIQEEFLKKNGTVVCRELKGVDTGEMIRSCEGCIEDAVRIAESVLFGKEVCQVSESEMRGGEADLGGAGKRSQVQKQ